MSIAQKIIESLGGTREAARLLTLPASTVQSWKRKGEIPIGRVIEVERITGIPRETLRPDLFAREGAA